MTVKIEYMTSPDIHELMGRAKSVIELYDNGEWQFESLSHSVTAATPYYTPDYSVMIVFKLIKGVGHG